MLSKRFFPRPRGLLAAIVAALLSSAVQAVPDAQFQFALSQFSMAQTGDSAAIERAEQAFQALLRGEPGDPLLMAYAGASTTMKARTTWLPWKKMSYADDGLFLLDKALTQLRPEHHAAPQNSTPAVLEVRFVASNVFLAVPGFMNRRSRGARLLNEVLSNPLLARSPLSFQGTVWLRAADLAEDEKRLNDARRFLKQVIDNNAPQASAARARLRALAS